MHETVRVPIPMFAYTVIRLLLKPSVTFTLYIGRWALGPTHCLDVLNYSHNMNVIIYKLGNLKTPSTFTFKVGSWVLDASEWRHMVTCAILY